MRVDVFYYKKEKRNKSRNNNLLIVDDMVIDCRHLAFTWFWAHVGFLWLFMFFVLLMIAWYCLDGMFYRVINSFSVPAWSVFRDFKQMLRRRQGWLTMNNRILHPQQRTFIILRPWGGLFKRRLALILD